MVIRARGSRHDPQQRPRPPVPNARLAPSAAMLPRSCLCASVTRFSGPSMAVTAGPLACWKSAVAIPASAFVAGAATVRGDAGRPPPLVPLIAAELPAQLFLCHMRHKPSVLGATLKPQVPLPQHLHTRRAVKVVDKHQLVPSKLTVPIHHKTPHHLRLCQVHSPLLGRPPRPNGKERTNAVSTPPSSPCRMTGPVRCTRMASCKASSTRSASVRWSPCTTKDAPRTTSTSQLPASGVSSFQRLSTGGGNGDAPLSDARPAGLRKLPSWASIKSPSGTAPASAPRSSLTAAVSTVTPSYRWLLAWSHSRSSATRLRRTESVLRAANSCAVDTGET